MQPGMLGSIQDVGWLGGEQLDTSCAVCQKMAILYDVIECMATFMRKVAEAIRVIRC